MRHHPSGLARLTHRFAAAVLVAGLLAPALGRAAEGDAETAVPDPVAVEPRWYESVLRTGDQIVDLLVIRPLAGVTLAAGAVLFIPAAVLSSPNGMEGIRDAYERFVGEPAEYFGSRPLGEF